MVSSLCLSTRDSVTQSALAPRPVRIQFEDWMEQNIPILLANQGSGIGRSLRRRTWADPGSIRRGMGHLPG